MNSMAIPNSFSVFPVKDKKPLVSWGEYSKRVPTSVEREGWKKQFGNHTLGIATGKVSKILVLDDDGGLTNSGRAVPKTWTVSTPRGGKHHYFSWTPELDNKVTTKVGVMDKVDVRGDGGFVVFYGFDTPYYMCPLAKPPQWLVDLLPSKNEVPESPKGVLGNLEDIKEGNRNDSFTRIAGSLRARGYSADEMYSLLESKANDVEFSLTELRTICDSVGRYAPRIEIAPAGTSIEEFLKDIDPVEWIVPGILAKKSIAFVAGLPETGKTWMLMDLAIECAKGGGLWLGKFPVEKAKVLFIDQERFKGETQRRFKSVISAKELRLSTLRDIYIRCGTTTRLDLQHSYEAFHKEISELKPDLIIVDSFATFHTKEENSRKDVQEVLEKIKQIRTEFGCTFVFIHHENKYAFNKDGDQEPSISQMAGSIAIPAACETVLTVRKNDGESSMVYHTKSTLSPTHEPFLIKVTDVDEAKTKIKVEAY